MTNEPIPDDGFVILFPVYVIAIEPVLDPATQMLGARNFARGVVDGKWCILAFTDEDLVTRNYTENCEPKLHTIVEMDRTSFVECLKQLGRVKLNYVAFDVGVAGHTKWFSVDLLLSQL